MIAQKLLLPAFALLSVVSAQSTVSACASATVTINSQADAAMYTGCASLNTVVIGEGASGTIDLSGSKLTTIKGDLICRNVSALITLSSTSITNIQGTFDLFSNVFLSTLGFSKLTEVTNILWSALPVLGGLTFTASIQKATSVVITNTFLSSLAGVNLTTVSNFDVNNNKYLNAYESTLTNVSSNLNIAGNGPMLALSFPVLSWAANMTFRDVKSLDTPTLKTVNGSLIFSNNAFDGYVAPNLTSVGSFANKVGDLQFVGNNAMNNITLPAITSIGGGVSVANNTMLESISFKALTEVGGAVDLTGNFTTPDMASLKNVQGALNIKSTAVIDCSGFAKLHDSGVVQGKDECKSTDTDPTSLTGGGTSTGSPAKTSDKPKGAASSFGVSHAVAGVSVFGAMLHLLL